MFYNYLSGDPHSLLHLNTNCFFFSLNIYKLYTLIHSSIIHNSQKVGVNQVPVNGRRDKQNAVYASIHTVG